MIEIPLKDINPQIMGTHSEPIIDKSFTPCVTSVMPNNIAENSWVEILANDKREERIFEINGIIFITLNISVNRKKIVMYPPTINSEAIVSFRTIEKMLSVL